MFVADAKLLLATDGLTCLRSKVLAVKPCPGKHLTCFGWEPDGSVVNSSFAFALTCIAAYGIINQVRIPQPLVQILESIPVQYIKHDSNENRLLQSLVESVVQRHANRTVQCPVYLAEELSRCTFQPQYVKSFVKLYQKRMSVNPALQMPQRMEDCVARLMTPVKTCKAAMKILIECVSQHTWHDGPWTVGHIMSSFFPVGASLNSSMHEEWARMNTQTPEGQTMALQIGRALFEKTK